MRYVLALLMLGVVSQCQALDFTIFVLSTNKTTSELEAVELKTWKNINLPPLVEGKGNFTVYIFKDAGGKSVQVSLPNSAPYFTVCE